MDKIRDLYFFEKSGDENRQNPGVFIVDPAEIPNYWLLGGGRRS